LGQLWLSFFTLFEVGHMRGLVFEVGGQVDDNAHLPFMGEAHVHAPLSKRDVNFDIVDDTDSDVSPIDTPELLNFVTLTADQWTDANARGGRTFERGGGQRGPQCHVRATQPKTFVDARRC